MRPVMSLSLCNQQSWTGNFTLVFKRLIWRSFGFSAAYSGPSRCIAWLSYVDVGSTELSSIHCGQQQAHSHI